jgi:hypothetical protein
MNPEDLEDEECFVIPVPEDAEEGDDLVFPILPEDEAAELIASL